MVLEGDDTGQELLEEALRVLASDVVGIEPSCRASTLLESRRHQERRRPRGRPGRARARAGAEGGDRHPGGRRRRGEPEPHPARGDRRPRHRAHRPAHPRRGADRRRALPHLGRAHGVGDAYGAKEWREGEGEDEAAFRTERIERRICRAVAEFSSGMPSARRRRSSAGRSTRSRRSTRACSRRRWTLRPSVTPRSNTTPADRRDLRPPHQLGG